MARDLYGEMLSRALNRGAPQGLFAAYIQPDEAALLRSQGGGVAPGGGQYMANGLPAYIADPGINIGGYGRAVGSSSVSTTPSVAPPMDAPPEVAFYSEPPREATRMLTGPSDVLDQAPLTQEGNLALIGSNPDYVNADGTLTDAGREAVSGNISDGGLGWLSPGSSLAQNNADATVAQIGHVNQGDASTGGYAIFNPHPQLGQPVVSVPEGMSMGMFGGLIPAAINTAIGMGVPGLGGALIGAGNTLFGHTLGSMARDAIGSATEGTALGRLLAIPGDIRGRIGEALSPITEGIGDALSGATRGLSGLLPDVTPPTSVPQVTPPGVQPPAPEVVVDEEQIVPGSEAEPFVRSYDDIDPEIARRLAANVLYGEERLRELEELA